MLSCTTITSAPTFAKQQRWEAPFVVPVTFLWSHFLFFFRKAKYKARDGEREAKIKSRGGLLVFLSFFAASRPGVAEEGNVVND